MIKYHNYYCLSRPVYAFLGVFGVMNLFLNVFLGNYNHTYDPKISLLIINALNIFVGVYEIKNLIERSTYIIMLEGYFNLLFYYPAMILYNGYK